VKKEQGENKGAGTGDKVGGDGDIKKKKKK
jgi:hypothetical protein